MAGDTEFTTFVKGLAASALLHLGVMPDPETNQTSENLPLACHTIDTIAMLQTKTKGNLTPEEERLLEQLLYDLRLRYVGCRDRG